MVKAIPHFCKIKAIARKPKIHILDFNHEFKEGRKMGLTMAEIHDIRKKYFIERKNISEISYDIHLTEKPPKRF